MRDHETGPASHQAIKRLTHFRFALHVEAGHRFVQDQDQGVANERASDGDALALAPGERGVADDELGFFCVAEEKAGIWRFGAEPDAGETGQLVARVGENGLTADDEGLTIYYAAQGRGYLIASSQGNSTYTVFERAGGNRHL